MSDKQWSLAEYVNALGDTDHRAAQEYCDLIREIRTLKEQQQCERERSEQWIPVSERLPEEDGVYFVFAVPPMTRDESFGVSIFEDGRFCSASYPWNEQITHWMPTQPPTAEDG